MDTPNGNDPIPMDKIKEDVERAKKEAAQKEPAPSPFTANFSKDAVLDIRLDLKAAIANEDLLHMMRGFLDNTRDKALAIVMQQRVELERQRANILSLQSKNGKGNFFQNLKLFKK